MISVYMAVTNDKYELPIAVGDTAKELGEQLGILPTSVTRALYRDKNNKTKRRKDYKIIKVKIPEYEGGLQYA